MCLLSAVVARPQRSALNSQPSTLNPQPSTLNPQPSTLHAVGMVVGMGSGGNANPRTLDPIVKPRILNPKHILQRLFASNDTALDPHTTPQRVLVQVGKQKQKIALDAPAQFSYRGEL